MITNSGTLIATFCSKRKSRLIMSKILLIENESFLRKLYCEFLSMSKYEMQTADNGKSGFERLSSFEPDLIILDIIMPVMDGQEFLKIIKEDLKYKNIPVLLLTGITDTEKIEECLKLGAVDYVEKTTHPVDLLNKIENILDESLQEESTEYDPVTEQKYDVENI